MSCQGEDVNFLPEVLVNQSIYQLFPSHFHILTLNILSDWIVNVQMTLLPLLSLFCKTLNQ